MTQEHKMTKSSSGEPVNKQLSSISNAEAKAWQPQI
jgi:hypothetical protein